MRKFQIASVIASFFLAASPCAVHADPVSGKGTWESTLLPRDLDQNGQTDAFYDTVLHVTWLRTANLTGLGWTASKAWVDDLEFGGYTDWQLPRGDACIGFNGATCTGSDLGHLWNISLGNKTSDYTNSHPTALTNTGNFINLGSYAYWSGLEGSPDTSYAQSFQMRTGSQVYVVKYSVNHFALAVRPGDVAAVPEPSTTLLALLGLGVFANYRLFRGVKRTA